MLSPLKKARDTPASAVADLYLARLRSCFASALWPAPPAATAQQQRSNSASATAQMGGKGKDAKGKGAKGKSEGKGAKGKSAFWAPREVRPATSGVAEWYSPPLPLALVRTRIEF